MIVIVIVIVLVPVIVSRRAEREEAEAFVELGIRDEVLRGEDVDERGGEGVVVRRAVVVRDVVHEAEAEFVPRERARLMQRERRAEDARLPGRGEDKLTVFARRCCRSVDVKRIVHAGRRGKPTPISESRVIHRCSSSTDAPSISRGCSGKTK